ALVRNVELLDSHGDTACGRFALQRLNLGIYFDRRDHIEALPGKPHCYFMSKTSPSSCDQDLLHRCLLSGSIGFCLELFFFERKSETAQQVMEVLSCRTVSRPAR